jgi:undecaprenyl-diphosphatase
MIGDRRTLAVVVAAFAALSVAAGAGLLREPDVRLLRLAQSRPSAALDVLGGALSVSGRAVLSVAVLGVLALWLRTTGRGRLGLRLLLALFATTVVELLMKFTVPQAPVPADVQRAPDPSLVDFVTPYPYPSGHMLRAVLVLGAVFVLWPNPLLRKVLPMVLLGAAGARVYLGTHWPSDVFGGALLGLVGLLWAFGSFNPRHKSV